MAPRAPIQTIAAERRLLCGLRRGQKGRIQTHSGENMRPRGGQVQPAGGMGEGAARDQAVIGLQPARPHQMVVTSPRLPQRRIAGAGLGGRSWGCARPALPPEPSGFPAPAQRRARRARGIYAAPGGRAVISAPACSCARCEDAVALLTPALSASFDAVSARPDISACNIKARAGSPIRAATRAMLGLSCIVR